MPSESLFAPGTDERQKWRRTSDRSYADYFKGYYNTWTEEVPDVSETDDELTATDVATTEDSISDVSPGTGPNSKETLFVFHSCHLDLPL
jgi:hypothetical protein